MKQKKDQNQIGFDINNILNNIDDIIDQDINEIEIDDKPKENKELLDIDLGDLQNDKESMGLGDITNDK